VIGKRKGYERVLLKLSGEVFGGEKGIGVDPDVVADVASQIAEVVKTGTQIAIVVGGGNYFRGAELQQRGMERARADYMGMLGTVMNCLALQDFLEKIGIDTRVQTAIAMGQVFTTSAICDATSATTSGSTPMPFSPPNTSPDNLRSTRS